METYEEQGNTLQLAGLLSGTFIHSFVHAQEGHAHEPEGSIFWKEPRRPCP